MPGTDRTRPSRLTAAAVATALAELQTEMAATRSAARPRIEAAHPSYALGAANLGDYVVLRQHDLREVQGALAGLGLSSLGRAEADVAPTLARVQRALRALGHAGVDVDPAVPARDLLDAHADALFGPAPPDRRVRIMVTASADFAGDPAAVRELVAAGMDVLRINCAHDTPDVWRKLAEVTRAAVAATGRDCRVLMDLGGPKLRTGEIQGGARVLAWHPTRDERGKVPQPVRVWFGALPSPFVVDVALPLAPGHKMERLRVGDAVRLRDSRGRDRELPVSAVTLEGILCTSDRSAWLEAGTPLRRVRARRLGLEVARLGPIPQQPGTIRLAVDDELVVTRDPSPGRPATRTHPATLPCTLPEVLAAVRVGDPILFDDGKIEGVVLAADADHMRVRIIRAREGGARLGADKGINLPATRIPVPALTAYDLECLDVAVELADMVGLSFVREPEDVRLLVDELAARGTSEMGIVLKIETQLGFQNLPAILLEAMRQPRIGVMIARGDLAVECGFERLAELQEEILWVCEAAHVPAIWATQVLDTLARKGIATRAEITDAAYGQRAECVMLNKGEHTVDAVRALADILRRMAAHHRKKTSMLRPLRSLSPRPA